VLSGNLADCDWAADCMKLIRFGDPGKERPGILLNDGAHVDVAGFGSDPSWDYNITTKNFPRVMA